MQFLNNKYRGINKTTDILSFPLYSSIKELPTNKGYLLGDIVINLHQAQTQSIKYDISLNDEIRRLLVHGVLHLLGFDHEKNRYQAKKMLKKEEDILNAIKELDR